MLQFTLIFVSLCALIAILFVILQRRTPGIFTRNFGKALTKMTLASTGMGIVTYMTMQFFQLQGDDLSFMSIFPKFSVIIVVSFGVYVLLSRLLHLREADPVIARVDAILFGRRRR